jgi:sugar phosphate isomerase/epimerase
MMEIGFTTWVFRQTSLEDIFAWAAENGLSGLQLDGCPDDLRQVKVLMTRYPGVKIHGLGCAQNYLVGDAAQRQQRADTLKRGIEAAAELGIGVIVIFAGRDPYKTVEDNLPLFQEVFTPLVEMAERHGVRLAMENCAQRNWWPAGGNLASTVENWRKLFALIPSSALGLAFDPSHFVWQGMDYIKAIREFGSRIYFAHAKDTEVRQDLLAEKSIYGEGWWHYRLPGWGLVDWPAFFTALREASYNGPVAIEHEDALWSHNDAEIKHGILLTQGFLRRFG